MYAKIALRRSNKTTECFFATVSLPKASRCATSCGQQQCHLKKARGCRDAATYDIHRARTVYLSHVDDTCSAHSLHVPNVPISMATMLLQQLFFSRHATRAHSSSLASSMPPYLHHGHMVHHFLVLSLFVVHPTHSRRGSCARECLRDNCSDDSPVALVAHQVAMTALPHTATQPQVSSSSSQSHLPVSFALRSLLIRGVRTEKDCETSKGSRQPS